MKRILEEIEHGDFTKEWEKPITKLKYKFIKFFATRQKINKIEKAVRKNLNLKIYDIYEENPPIKEEIEKIADIADELKLFEQYYE